MISNVPQKCSDHKPKVHLRRTVALVGLMGAGKTTIGKRLAAELDIPFCDSDEEIEAAAGMSIPEIFKTRGEAEFRDGERRVIARLLEEPPFILATGGGAYMSSETRKVLREKAFSIWLKADLSVLVERTGRKDTRPLLRNGNPREILGRLIEARYPIYAQTDAMIESDHRSHEHVVSLIIDILRQKKLIEKSA